MTLVLQPTTETTSFFNSIFWFLTIRPPKQLTWIILVLSRISLQDEINNFELKHEPESFIITNIVSFCLCVDISSNKSRHWTFDTKIKPIHLSE